MLEKDSKSIKVKLPLITTLNLHFNINGITQNFRGTEPMPALGCKGVGMREQDLESSGAGTHLRRVSKQQRSILQVRGWDV